MVRTESNRAESDGTEAAREGLAHLLFGALLWVDVLAMFFALGPLGWPARRAAAEPVERAAVPEGAPA